MSRKVHKDIEIRTRILGTEIPKVVHQTFKTRALPAAFQANVDRIKSVNPQWQHILYDDDDIERFITQYYGQDVLNSYLRISPLYGAARADLFRYLLMYQCGGVYLDIKSTILAPLDSVLRTDDKYLLSHWRNGPGEIRAAWGIHPELAEMARGEYQQWHIICVPGHPFLEAVIKRVLHNIDAYRAWRQRLGQHATIRVTGPIAYTQAIRPILQSFPYRLVQTEQELGLEYSILPDFKHADLFKSHYVRVQRPMISSTGTIWLATQLYLGARGTRNGLRKLARSARSS